MNLHIQKKNGKNNSKGFYIALGVCLIAVGVAAWTTYDSVVNYAAPQKETQSEVQSKTAPANNTVSGVYVETESSKPRASSETSSKPAPSSRQEAQTPKQASEPAEKTAAAVTSFSYPVSSKTVVQKFSQDPVYCKTTLDWRAHTGLDLGAKAGEAVKSMAPGTVTKVYQDDKCGKTIVVAHGNTEAWYCGLDQTKVKEKDTVSSGQEIGTVGVVPIEKEEASHLHLALKVDGEYVDALPLLH